MTSVVLPVSKSPITKTLNRYSRFWSIPPGGAEGVVVYIMNINRIKNAKEEEEEKQKTKRISEAHVPLISREEKWRYVCELESVKIWIKRKK